MSDELYVPRKCSATNRLIAPSDHASVQINFGHLNEDGVFTGEVTTFALAGEVRRSAQADQNINHLAVRHGLMRDITAFTSAAEFSQSKRK